MCFILMVTVLLRLAVSSSQSNKCGSELYSIYNTELNVTCYIDQEIDDLPVLNEDRISRNSIFFIDPSCKGGLNVREACSVEAAAKTNPKKHVNVFFAGPVTQHCVKSEPLASLLTYKNVNLFRIYVDEFSKGTGLYHQMQNVDFDGGLHPMPYALDLLKFITLHKFDGIILDLDMMVTRPFDELPVVDNWVGIANHTQGTLSSDIFAASSNTVGRNFVRTVMRLLETEPVADVGGASLIKSAMERICGVIPFENSTQELSMVCQGLVLYTSKFFFPVPCDSSHSYFTPALDVVDVTNSFTQHLCNALTFDKPLHKQTAYAQLMNNFCPKVYQHLERMGFKETDNVEELRDRNVNDLDKSGVTTKSSSENATKKAIKWYYEIKESKKPVNLH